MKSCFEANFNSIALAEPCKDGLVEIVNTPIYNVPVVGKGGGSEASYSHKGLRAACNLPRALSVLKETPVAYVPTLAFDVEKSLQDPKNQGRKVTTAKFDVKPLDDEEIRKSSEQKDNFFRQGWPVMSPFLTHFTNRNVLQLVCTLILKNPFYAGEYGCHPSMGNIYPPGADGGKGGECTFMHYTAVMHSLCFFGCSKKNLRPWAKFADFCRLYYSVKANMVECSTLVTGTM